MVPSDSDEMGITSQTRRNAECPAEPQHTLPHTPLPSTDTHVQMSCITVLPDRLHLGFERWTEIVCSVSTALYSLER